MESVTKRAIWALTLDLIECTTWVGEKWFVEQQVEKFGIPAERAAADSEPLGCKAERGP